MPRKKEFRDSPRYDFETLGGQSDHDDTAPDQPWRYALVQRMYQEWRYVGATQWKLVDTLFPPRTVMAEFTPRQMRNLLESGFTELTYAAVTFNENLAAQQKEG